ncbi:MAG: hypothetical protein ACYDCK_01325 [Thermoplasmatota archaeon]
MLVASLLLASAFTVAFALNREPTSSATANDAEVRSVATSALATMLAQPGKTLGGATAWDTDPDHLASFGLTSPDAPNFLDYHKVLALRHGNLTASANNAPDYTDVRSAAGLNGYDFHIRTYPILKGIDDPHWSQIRGLRTAYLGHFYQSVGAPSARISVSQDTNASDHTEAHVKIDYDSGPGPDIFQVTLDIDTTNGHYIQQFYSKAMSPGDTDLVVARFYNENWPTGTSDYAMRVTVAEADYSQTVLDGSGYTQHLAKGSNNYNLGGPPKKAYWENCDSNVQFKLDTWDQTGSRYKHDVATTYSVTDPNGVTWITDASETLGSGHDDSFRIDCSGHGNGTYTLVIKTAAVQQTMHFAVFAQGIPQNAYIASVDNVKERGYLNTLVEEFNNWTYVSSGNATGDVFRDVNEEPNDFVDNAMARYNIIVIGSGIAQNELDDVAQDLEGWMQAGGTLIVLGNDDNSGQWLQNILGEHDERVRFHLDAGPDAPDPPHAERTRLP